MREFIVTGSTGYIGYVLVNELINKGYKPVKILIRSMKNLERFKDLPIKYAIGDINDEDFLNKEITDNSVVFHLAGVIEIGTLKSLDVYETNVNGCINVVNACIRNKVERFIYTSSVSAIIPPKQEQLIVEPKEFNSKKVVGQYAKTKAIATKYIFDKAKSGEPNAIATYPSCVIGPYDYNISSIGQVVTDYMNNKLKVITKGKYNFIDVRDVVDGLIKAYEVGLIGEGYLLSGESYTLKEMFIVLNEILGRKKLPVYLPLWFIKIIIPFVEFHYLIRGKVPVFSRTSIKIINQNCNFDNSKAKNELGFNPRSVKESFNDMVSWFYENKKELVNFMEK